MAAEAFVKEIGFISSALEPLIARAAEMAKSDPENFELRAARTLLAKICGTLEQLRALRPTQSAKFYPDYVEAATTSILAAEEARSELQALIDIKLEEEQKNFPPVRRSERASTMLPRNLEIVIPMFNGDCEQFAAFKEAFIVATKDTPMSDEHKFLLYRDHLGPKIRPQVANMEISAANFERMTTLLEERYGKRDRIVQALYAKLDAIPAASKSTVGLRSTLDSIEEVLQALQMQKEEIDTNVYIQKAVYKKFPTDLLYTLFPDKTPNLPESRQRLERYISMREQFNPDPVVNLVPEIAAIALASPVLSAPKKDSATDHSRQSPRSKKESTKKIRKKKCLFCEGEHFAYQCTKYPTPADRVKFLGKEACLVCASKKHRPADCPPHPPKVCVRCHAVNLHHSALCTNSPIESPVNPPPTPKMVGMVKVKGSTYLTTTHAVVNPVTGRSVVLRIFLDIGAGDSYITSQAANLLALRQSPPTVTPVAGFAEDSPRDLTSREVMFHVHGLDRPIIAKAIKVISEFLPAFDYEQFRRDNPAFRELTFAPVCEGAVDVLIGSDYYFNFVRSRREIADNVFLVDTFFGYMIAGKSQESSGNAIAQMMASTVMTESLKTFWDLETLGIRPAEIRDRNLEDEAYSQFTSNLVHQGDRYQAVLPWRSPDLFPPSNERQSRARLRALCRQHSKDDNFIADCDAIFQSQLRAGIIERAEPGASPAHYLPWRIVRTPEKSTPLRIVYDASARASRSAPSLNDCLLKGMNLTPLIPSILIRFRLHPVAIAGDIKHAFHNVGIAPQDRDFLRFFWLRSPELDVNEDANLSVFRFTRVPFGCVSSGFLLAATIRYHLNQSTSVYAAKAKRDLYIDDYMASIPSEEEAVRTITETCRIFSEAGMLIHKWITNSDHVRAAIEPHLTDTKEIAKILGLHWDTKLDIIRLVDPELVYRYPDPITKRQVLQAVASIFDPLGWLAPITIAARIFMRTLHELNLSWNAELDNISKMAWSKIVRELAAVSDFQFKRYFEGYSENSVSLHVFCDASAKAYAAAVYVRFTNAITNRPSSILVISKARVAPLAEVSIPRLELLAALIGSRLLVAARSALRLEQSPAFLWTDSTCVLDWMNSAHKLPVFVQNRVDEIRKVPGLECRHVAGIDNPADMPSRGISASQLRDSDSWWYGPAWLRYETTCWPPAYVPSAHLPAVVQCPIVSAAPVAQVREPDPPFGIDASDFSGWTALLKRTAYCVFAARRFLPRLWHRNRAPTEIARTLWLRFVQAKHFASLLADLRDDTKKRKHELISKLRLFLDKNGLIRTDGRLTNVPDFAYDAKFGVLLPPPKSSHIAFLLVDAVHQRIGHQGTSYTLMATRRRYWIMSGRKQVNHVVTQCMVCKRSRSRPYPQPVISDLPPFRLDVHKFPFAHIGLDIAGPLYVSNVKRWILLTTCLVTRAIALEVLDDVTTPMIMFAYRRIVARYSEPEAFLSDNAPQFLLLAQHLHRTRLTPFQWKYIVDYSPWEGGCYERLVKAVKDTLEKATILHKCAHDVHFRTLVAETEAVLNDRPITYVGADPAFKILTPNDFLRIRIAHDSNTPRDLPPDATLHAKRLQLTWKQHVEALDQITRLWKREYLQYLKERRATQVFKAQTNLRSPRVGDVVLIELPNYKKAQWPVAVITQLQISHDKQVRSCVLRLSTGTKVVRPVQALYYLELNEND